MAKHRVRISLPDGTAINQLPLNNIELTESLVEDDTGAYYYEKSIGKLKYDNRAGVFEAFKEVEDSGDRCEEATITIDVNDDGSWKEVFAGVFSMSHCKFNLDQCWVEFEPEEFSVYRCLKKSWDTDLNILEASSPITVKVPSFGENMFTISDIPELQNAYYEFYVTDGTVGDEPYNQGEVGYNANNQTTVTLSGNSYQIFWRAVFYMECGESGCPASGTLTDGAIIFNYELVSDDCADAGLCKNAIINFELLGTTFDTFDSFAASDFTEVDDPSDVASPGVQIAQGIYGSKYVFYLYNVQNEDDFSNARTLQSVFDFLLSNSCSDVTSVHSNFFKINADGDSIALSSDPDKYANVAVFQITDILNASADQDATIGMLSLKDLLTELSKFKIRWRIDNGDTLRIEHIEDFIASSSDDYSGIEGFAEYEYDRNEVPKRETFDTLAQREPMFVGTDIEYAGACVGDEVQNNQMSKFTFDLGFCITHPEEVPSDGFFMMNYEVFGSGNYIRFENSPYTGDPVANGAFGWAFILPLLYLYQSPAPSGEVNNGSFASNSDKKLRKSRMRLDNKSGDNIMTIDTSKLFVTKLGSGVIDELSTDLRTFRSEVQYRF